MDFEIPLLQLLLNKISSFHLEIVDSGLVQKCFQRAEELLKLLKPILDSFVYFDLAAADEEVLGKAFAELDRSISEVKELFGKWQPSSSKFFLVLQTESLLSRIRNLGLDVAEFLKSVNEHLPEQSSSSASSTEYCIQKLENLGLEEMSSTVKAAIRVQVEGVGTGSDILAEIADNLSLRTNLEILIEVVALENLKEASEQAERSEEVELFDQLIGLVARMHDQLIARVKKFETSGLAPVPPPDLCCPLSLELMTDPVIVASGQTYERLFIKRWIELGLTVCPKTRHVLGHTLMITNYTVKALIVNWCDLNDVKLPDHNDLVQQLSPNVVHVESGTSLVPGKLQREGRSRLQALSVPASSLSGIVCNWKGLDAARISTTSPSGMEVSGATCVSATKKVVDSIAEPSASPYVMEGSDAAAATDETPSSIETQVRKLVEDLESSNIDTQREATAQIRELARNNVDNRIMIAACGAIALLVSLLRSTDMTVQETAVTALLNLSINNANKTAIVEAEAIAPLIHVLETGSSKAKENAAAALFSLSVINQYKPMIGEAGAIGPLVDLLENGTPRGKKDAATALFNLSMFAENRNRIVAAGAVRHLVELMHPAAGMVDKAVAVLANLATIFEGRNAIAQEGGIPVLVEVVELGSPREKEHAAAALLQLCVNSNRHCKAVLGEGAVPPLVAMAESGTPRGKEKAQSLVCFFRNQRHGNAGGSQAFLPMEMATEQHDDDQAEADPNNSLFRSLTFPPYRPKLRSASHTQYIPATPRAYAVINYNYYSSATPSISDDISSISSPSLSAGSFFFSISSSSPNSLSTLQSQVKKLAKDLNSTSIDTQREATGQLRLLAKHNLDYRIAIASSETITLVVNLLRSTDMKIQENAAEALLYLSINDNGKTTIADAEAIESLIYVLETGSPEGKENSAATLFGLAVMEENKVRIGRAGAIGRLVDLLGNGTLRGKMNAATALFNLSLYYENKAMIVAAGVVKHLVELMDPAAGMVDKAVAVLANLATIREGRNAIGQQGGIPVLVKAVELGSARGKENAAATLLQLCTNSTRFCNMVLQQDAVPSLVALSQSGTPRAKEKAQLLISYFRNQRNAGSN